MAARPSSFGFRRLGRAHRITNNLDDPPPRIFVRAIGSVNAMLSVTGVSIWCKRRRARRWRHEHPTLAVALGVEHNA